MRLPLHFSLRMKRALPSYEDLFEDGEIIEEGPVSLEEKKKNEYFDEPSSSSEEEEMGLKTVLPVGKYNEKFKEGQVPESGEQYLCTVRSQRKKLENIVSVACDDGKGVKLDVLIKFGCGVVEVDEKWAEEFGECLKKSEKEFEQQLEICEDECEECDGCDNSCDTRCDTRCDHLLRLTPSDWFKKLYETGEIEATMKFLHKLKTCQDLCEKLLNLHRKWLLNSALNLDSGEIVNKVATWLQALIMCRDRRLTSPEISNLRQLCLALHPHTERIEMKEVIVAIVKKYGQVDLIKYK